MVKKKNVEIVLDEQTPKVLIMGGGIAADKLSNYHKDNSCHVTMEESYYPSLAKFDYIYHFGNIKEVKTGVEKHLKDNGKFLYIDIGDEENLLIENIKIIRVGDLSLWNIDELVSAIIKSMFTGGKRIVDVRKKSDEKVISARRLNKQTIPFKAISNQTVIIREKNIKPYNPSILLEKQHILFKYKHILSMSIILILLIMAFISSLFFFNSFKSSVSGLMTDYTTSNWGSLKNNINDLKNKTQLLNKIYDLSDRIIFPLRWFQSWKDSGSILSVSSTLLENGLDTLTYMQILQNRNSDSISIGNKISKNDLILLKTKMNNMQLVLDSSKTKLKDVNIPFVDKDILLNFMQTTSGKLSTIDELLPLFEQVILASSPKVYLVLFHNNMELRPTGGFIGSFALLTLDGGKMTNMKVYDVYTADGQLKGHIDPPLPIRKYLNQPHYFLRDSNFDPDFMASSVQAAWFLQKEIGINVDGIVGINLNTIQKILQVTGPVKLVDFGNEEITADNFFFKTHFFAQDKFFPGSTQKKDFLTSASNTLLDKITNSKKSLLFDLLPAVKQLLDEKDILIFANDDNIQKISEKKGWAGRMINVKCVYNQNESNQPDMADLSKTCLPDYLSINEANLGVNKANYFVNKSVIVDKNISDDGTITSTVSLSYENTGTPEVFTGAMYSNYLRVFVPLGSILNEVSINNIPLSVSDITVENYQNDKTVFGLLVKIAPQNKGIIKFVYTLPKKLAKETESYQLFFQKQAGDKKAPFVLSIRNSSARNLKSLNFTPNVEKNNDIYYSTDTSYDRIFAFSMK